MSEIVPMFMYKYMEVNIRSSFISCKWLSAYTSEFVFPEKYVTFLLSDESFINVHIKLTVLVVHVES